MGRPECPYARRWYLSTPFGSIRLHQWYSSDDDRAFHDHAWWFVTFILSGGYTDVSPAGEQRMDRFSVAYRPANHRHTVKVDKGGCWTIVVTGPEKRFWGFWTKGRFKKANKYFLENGHHQCET